MTRRTTLRTTLAAATATLLALGLAACSSDDPSADADRIVLTPAEDGGSGAQPVGNPVGDGTSAEVEGYRMADVRLPGADGTGDVAFRVLDPSGAPLLSYTEEQTKLLHLYVVRDDLAQFRHLHPTLADDGTWTARVDLGSPGRWRVVAEFIPQGATNPIVLGTTLAVAGEWTPVEVPRGTDAETGEDGVLEARLLAAGEVGPNGRLRLRLSDADGEPVALGSYLGTSAHLTGFAADSRGFVHVHPYGAPEVTDDGTVLTFHTVFTQPGDYRLFLQVRVDGLLHQLAVTAPVTATEEAS
ncbi:hypothetical protein [Nocardioides daeguensis]|uniref:Secreted protein n=1 Tax=Nocardioides daeguensis TaxID=908359 RepID=A0ABP6WLY9_9ACTN|nr:hypothetical protein [Nocardioides daeguensis]MBV6729065.1 hypothetical protein [Nocardioides daeguensis]MCR1774931.1 hypothetical protein [Nocardioides daeguensis]